MLSLTTKNIFSSLVLMLATGAAYAQFVWIDANGTKQYSDRPPPASIPKNKILKEPSLELRNGSQSAGDSETVAGSASAKGVVPATPAKGPLTTAEKNADFVKRKSDQAEADKKSNDDAKEAAEKSKNCERAQAYNRSLQSGERIATTDKNGERAFLSDEKRTQEVRETKRVMDGCK